MNTAVFPKLNPNFNESRHPLSGDERLAAQGVLAAIGRHFTNFQGSYRQAYDAMTEWTPIADGVTLDVVDERDARGWWVRPSDAPADRVILFIHGGAYALGSAKAYRGFVSQIVGRTGVAAFVLDYPLAPEYPFPAAYEAVVAARRWLGGQGFERIALVGDSAGGGLALATLRNATDTLPSVAAVVVFSPWTDLALAGESIHAPEERDPIFQPAVLAGAAKTYLGEADPKDHRASPLYAISAELPPIAIQVGTAELLLDDARRYAALAAESGGEVTLEIFEGLHHVFQRSVVELASARQALDMASAFIAAHWQPSQLLKDDRTVLTLHSPRTGATGT